MPSSEQCVMCRHFRAGLVCDAVPEGIPEEIITGEHDHREPYPGDHGVRFEPVDEEAARIVDAMFEDAE